MLHSRTPAFGAQRSLRFLSAFSLLMLGPWLNSLSAAVPEAPAQASRSHLPAKVFATCEGTEGLELKDFCLTRDGQVLTLVGPAGPRARMIKGASVAKGDTEVRLFNAAGEPIKQWKVEFAAEAVNVAPDGSVYLGGAGKVAKYQLDGTQLAIGEAPQMGKLLADPELLKQQAQEMIESERAAREERIKLLEQQLEQQKALEKKQAETGEATPADAARPAEARPAFKAVPRLKVLPVAPGADKSSAVDPATPAEVVRTAQAQVQAAAEEAKLAAAERAAAHRQVMIEKATAARLKAVQRVAAVQKAAAPTTAEQKTGEPPAVNPPTVKPATVKPATVPATRLNTRILLSNPATRTRNAATIERQLDLMKQQGDRDIEAVTAQILAGLNTVNAISASDKYLFVACREAKGYGYAVWRTDLDFKNPKQIVSGLSGCCGQMDVQVAGDNEIYVAENSRHRVVRYNADGKKLGMFGKRDREGAGEGFGGCCNPMNICFGSDGAVLVAESNGVVKHFTPAGEFVSVVGAAAVPEGCKNSAIGVTSDGSQLFYIDVKNAKIHVLAKAATDAAN